MKVLVDRRDFFFFFFKQKTAYEISSRDWSSDVCSSDLVQRARLLAASFGPVEQLGKRRAEPVPDLLDRIEFEPEGLSERLLRQPCINSDTKFAERQLQQCESSRRVEMIEHPRKHMWGVHLRC